jgi:protein-tyrosine phosphatase
MATSILFVCMGNICRSPAAEAVFEHLACERGVAHAFELDSAGTGGWHAGEPADARSAEEGSRRGYTLRSRARKVVRDDLDRFDLIVCMDRENQSNLRAMGSSSAQAKLLLDWHPTARGEDVPDPYYGGDEGFVHMYDLIEAACEALLASRCE